MPKLFKGCLVILVACFLLGCSINTILFFVIPSINQLRWNDVKPENYSVTVYYGWLGGSWRAYEEIVTDQTAHRTYYDFFRTGEPTIDQLFDEIKGLTLNPVGLLLLISAEYDPIYGFPVRVVWNDFDLGDVVEVKNFTAGE